MPSRRTGLRGSTKLLLHYRVTWNPYNQTVSRNFLLDPPFWVSCSFVGEYRQKGGWLKYARKGTRQLSKLQQDAMVLQLSMVAISLGASTVGPEKKERHPLLNYSLGDELGPLRSRPVLEGDGNSAGQRALRSWRNWVAQMK